MSAIRDYNGCATALLVDKIAARRIGRLTWSVIAQALLKETEKLLEKWKHPDPYVHPTAPGGANCS